MLSSIEPAINLPIFMKVKEYWRLEILFYLSWELTTDSVIYCLDIPYLYQIKLNASRYNSKNIETYFTNIYQQQIALEDFVIAEIDDNDNYIRVFLDMHNIQCNSSFIVY